MPKISWQLTSQLTSQNFEWNWHKLLNKHQDCSSQVVLIVLLVLSDGSCGCHSSRSSLGSFSSSGSCGSATSHGSCSSCGSRGSMVLVALVVLLALLVLLVLVVPLVLVVLLVFVVLLGAVVSHSSPLALLVPRYHPFRIRALIGKSTLQVFSTYGEKGNLFTVIIASSGSDKTPACHFGCIDPIVCIYLWTHSHKTCFQLTSNIWVSGVKLWSFPA